jgi:hypothetical protein
MGRATATIAAALMSPYVCEIKKSQKTVFACEKCHKLMSHRIKVSFCEAA